MAPIKQGNDGNWYEKTPSGWVPTNAPAAPAAAATPASETTDETPYIDRLKWGMSRAPGGLMQTAARVANWVHPSPTTQAWVDAPWDAAADEAYRSVFGGEPPGPPHGVDQRAVGAIGTGFATPVGGVSKTAVGLAIEGLSLGSGALAGAAAEEAGLPWWAQMVASMAGAAAPALGIRAGGARAANAKRRTAAEGVADSMHVRPAPSPDMPAPSASSDTILRASSELKAMIPSGFEDEAAQRLDDVVGAYPIARTRPVTSQALDELGGETMESATMSLTKGDRTVSRNVAGQKLRAVRAIDDEMASLRPDGDFDTAQAAYDVRTEKAATRERNAWARVPLEQMPRVPSQSIKQAVDEITTDVGKAGSQDLPAIFGIVKGYDDWEPFSELQALRSKLLRLERAGRNHAATESAMAQGALAGRLRQRVEDLIDDVAENNQVSGAPLTPGTAATAGRQEGVDALRKAHRITRENRELFSQKSDVVKAFADPKEAKNLAASLLRGGPREARQALSIFRHRPQAQDSVRRVVMDEVIGPDILTEGAAKSALKRVREKRQTMVALFGADHVQNVERLLRKAQTVRSGRAGTRAGALGTGSANLAGDAIAKLESAMEHMGSRSAVGTAVDIARKQTLGRVKDALDREFQQVMAAALIDPELARDLLRIPGPAALPKWADRMDQHLTRNGIRLVTQPQNGGE